MQDVSFLCVLFDANPSHIPWLLEADSRIEGRTRPLLNMPKKQTKLNCRKQKKEKYNKTQSSYMVMEQYVLWCAELFTWQGSIPYAKTTTKAYFVQKV